MVKIREAILVEGRYDKNTLSQVVDAYILESSGFQIFHDEKNLMLLRRIAQERGLIVFTDSDGAGFVIRNYVKSAIPNAHLKHAYIPDIYGKERRKSAPGKEGKMGVEGMTPQVILQCLQRAGATFCDESINVPDGQITKADLVEMGLSGRKNSAQLRLQLLRMLNLPEHMSSNALLQALNQFYTLEQLQQMLTQIQKTISE